MVPLTKVSLVGWRWVVGGGVWEDRGKSGINSLSVHGPYFLYTFVMFGLSMLGYTMSFGRISVVACISYSGIFALKLKFK